MYLILFLKGLLMGICDIIPGISGGTIAFVTGIYSRLMESIKNIGSFKFRKDDIIFLLVLGSGIGVSIISGSYIISSLLKTHFSLTISFFIGLVLASSFLMYRGISVKKSNSFLLLGLVGGVAFSFAVPTVISPTLPYIFLGGFVAISAMFLPGISGAFILLIMGLYEVMIDSLHTFDMITILVFLSGAAIGALLISRVIIYMLKNYESVSLSFLLGLVLGCLSIPLRQVAVFSFGEIASILAGGLIVMSISRIRNKIP